MLTPHGFAELSQFQIDPSSVRLLNAAFCRRRHVVVLGVVDPRTSGPVTVGMLHPEDVELVVMVQRVLARPVRPVRLNDFEIDKALDVGFGEAEAEQGGKGHERLPIRSGATLTFKPDAPVPSLVSELLGHAVAVGASDLHIECYEEDVDVRLRKDGELVQIGTSVSRGNVEEVVARLKVLAEMNLAERREAQDGRIMTTYEDGTGSRPIDFRVSVVPGPFGEDAVLRVLDSRPLVGLDRLGFPADVLARFRTLARSPEGILFVTGPTGSGKTTTLYSTLAEITDASSKILTVEDPIELQFAKVNQKQVGPKMGFADYARAFMRQDPDILLIGEIRDEETADIAIRAAQTGHLVLTTLHTNGSVGTVSRLRVLGIDPGLVADTMLGALSQRLIRRVCAACVEPRDATEGERALLDHLKVTVQLVRGRGCEACGQTGYRGRVGLYELFHVDTETADRITREVSSLELRRFARSRGMRTLFDDALEKLEAGVTTLEEIRARLPHRILLEAIEDASGE
ncbi:MAG: type II/IV secretion system protein [Polyangiaceae bacterium]|nr:type II/IV secretion system protein [Polyangiaceae bacterium]